MAQQIQDKRNEEFDHKKNFISQVRKQLQTESNLENQNIKNVRRWEKGHEN